VRALVAIQVVAVNRGQAERVALAEQNRHRCAAAFVLGVPPMPTRLSGTEEVRRTTIVGPIVRRARSAAHFSRISRPYINNTMEYDHDQLCRRCLDGGNASDTPLTDYGRAQARPSSGVAITCNSKSLRFQWREQATRLSYSSPKNHMGLDIFPICSAPNIPGGFSHPEGEPCPFRKDGITGGNCCWLDGRVTTAELEALGESALAERMHDNMTPHEAIDFAVRLNNAANALERRHRYSNPKPTGAGWSEAWDSTDRKCKKYSTFDEAIASIREAARWYKEIGSRGCSVHTWY
jgi:hypothetical protein